MSEYHKIESIFKRDMAAPKKPFILGSYTCPEFAYLKDCDWAFTEKVDGTNIRITVPDTGALPVFGGRSDNAAIPAPLITRLQEYFLPQCKRMQEMLPAGTVLYGEGYGAKIQSGGKYRLDQGFVLFDVNVGGNWLERRSVEDIADKLGLDVVPLVGRGPLAQAIDMCRRGFASRWGAFQAEGIVVRPVVELRNRRGGRVITKIKCRDFQ